MQKPRQLWSSLAPIFAALAYLLTATANANATGEPKIPPGLDPGGIAVALLGPGVDYTRPAIATRLARDGEGDLIAWDFTDNDGRPYAARPSPAADVLLHLAPHARLIVVREQSGDPVAFGRMMQFVRHTPAQIVVWPAAAPSRKDWPILIDAANHFRQILFVIPVPKTTTTHGRAAYNRLQRQANVLLVGGVAAHQPQRRHPPTADILLPPLRHWPGSDTAQILPDEYNIALRAAALAARAAATHISKRLNPPQLKATLARLARPTPQARIGIITNPERAFINASTPKPKQ